MKRMTLIGLALCIASPAAHGETYFVHPISHMGDFPNIQTAIDYAQDGDIIELGDGIFQGDGNRDINFLGKGITVRSQSGDPEACIIDCEGSSAAHRGFTLADVGSLAAIEGLTIENGLADWGGAIICFGDSSPLIEQCVFRRNTAWGEGGAFYNWVDAFPRFVQCTFAENWAYESGGGICI